MVRRTPIAAGIITGSASRSRPSATTRSAAYLTANWRPFGFGERAEMSGRPPKCSTVSRLVIFSNSLGTNATWTPSSSQRFTRRSSTSWGARENVITTCSTPYCSTIRSRSQLAPRTGSGRESSSASSGSLSRKPIGLSPSWGWDRSREAASLPTLPAPMISVGRNDSPWRYACARDQWSATRPAARYAAAKAQARIPWGHREAGSDMSPRRRRTGTVASEVATRTARSSSRSS